MKRYKYALLVISITSALLFQANAVENTEKAKSIEEDSTTTESTNAFDYILVERNGGGDKLFPYQKEKGITTSHTLPDTTSKTPHLGLI